MKLISNRLARFQPSLTVKISQKAREMTRDGIKVISLSSGEPDFDTPNHIKQFDLFKIHIKKRNITRLTQTHDFNEINPEPINKNNYHYLCDENGIFNHYQTSIQ